MRDTYRAIRTHPQFLELERKRRRLSWLLTAVVLIAYFGFILAVAFAPHLLATPLHARSAISWGFPLGLAIIILSFALTGVYVYCSNREYDSLTRRLLAAVASGDAAQE